MPAKELTSDNEIRAIAELENRIVITKDNDFFDSYILRKSPQRLLLISTGNIVNKVSFQLFEKNLELIVRWFESYDFLELTNDELYAQG